MVKFTNEVDHEGVVTVLKEKERERGRGGGGVKEKEDKKRVEKRRIS